MTHHPAGYRGRPCPLWQAVLFVQAGFWGLSPRQCWQCPALLRRVDQSQLPGQWGEDCYVSGYWSYTHRSEVQGWADTMYKFRREQPHIKHSESQLPRGIEGVLRAPLPSEIILACAKWTPIYLLVLLVHSTDEPVTYNFVFVLLYMYMYMYVY